MSPHLIIFDLIILIIIGELLLGELRNAYESLIRKPEGKGQHGGPECGWGMRLRLILYK
jgi:hypothetical protein